MGNLKEGIKLYLCCLTLTYLACDAPLGKQDISLQVSNICK